MSAQRVSQVLSDAPVPPSAVILDWLGTNDCEGSKHHSPQPLLVRPYYLSTVVNDLCDGVSREDADDMVYLCATCMDHLTIYVSILHAYNGATPYAVRRDFGNIIRALGDRAWEHYVAQRAPAPV